MDGDTYTILQGRKTALEAEMKPMLDLLAPLQVRHARVCLALDAIALLKPSEKNISLLAPRKLKPEGTMRIKPMILEILERNPEGLKALDILSSIKNEYLIDIMRTSLSPQLSRLKRDGEIDKNGKIWLLPKNKPSDESEGIKDILGAGWNQSSLPTFSPAGSIPVASTPYSEPNDNSVHDVSSTHANEHTDRKEL